mmetsp:Transcript_60618/g.69214  ORF Transcript_60618/g.69214 Transcript_60618/m.69214 type:complete len:220 (-) Transcript_60618:34-693(-)
MSLVGVSSSGSAQFEWPQEVVSFLEVRSTGENFVDQIFNADDTVLAQNFFDDTVVGEGESLSVELTVTSLVDQISDGLEGRITVSDIGLDLTQHVYGSTVDLNENSVVDLSKSQQLQTLLDIRVHVHNTLGSDNQSDLRLIRDVEVTVLLGTSQLSDGVTFLGGVLFGILSGSLHPFLSLNLSVGLGLVAQLRSLSGNLGVSLLLLLETFGDGNSVSHF